MLNYTLIVRGKNGCDKIQIETYNNIDLGNQLSKFKGVIVSIEKR